MIKILSNLLTAIANAVSQFFKWKIFKLSDNSEQLKEQKAEREAAEKKLEEACNNGSLDDLLDATQKIGETK